MPNTPEASKIRRSLDQEATEKQLSEALIAAGIPLEAWGQGVAKTVGHLLNELRSGESRIDVYHDSTIKRHVGVVWVDVLHLASDGTIFALRETKQEYADGRVRRRQLDISLGEKLKPDEEPDNAAVRALQEELEIHEPDTLHFLSSDITERTSSSYPGITNQHESYTYVATLGKTAFNPDGYIERQPNMTNYYEWDIVRAVR